MRAGACSPSRATPPRASWRSRSAPSGRATPSTPGPEPLDAALIFAPAGELVPAALRACAPGGVVVCAGIHMSDIPSFPYELLWEERVVRSVANLTRDDAREMLALAPTIPIRTTVTEFALDDAETALSRLRARRDRGLRGAQGAVSCPAYGPRPVRLAAPQRAANASAAGVS